MTWCRVLLALGAGYNAGAHDPRGLVGTLSVWASLELAVAGMRWHARTSEAAWRRKYPRG